MSTIKSSNEHLTLNADGSSKDIKFQANGVEKASISSAGAFTSTTIDATALTGDVPNASFPSTLPAASAANLTAIPAANITGTLPAISGASLTALNASNLGSGTVPTARLGSGTASSSTFLRGDSTYAEAGGGKVLQVVYASNSGIAATSSTSFAATGHHIKTITSTALNSSFLVTLAYNPQIGDGNAEDGQLVLRSSVDSYASNLSWGRNFDRGSYHEFNTYVQCLHSPSQAAGTAITYKSYFNSPSGSTFKLSDYWTNAGLGAAPSTIIIMEIGA